MSVKPKPPAPIRRRDDMTIAHGPSINPDVLTREKCSEKFCNNLSTRESRYCSIECEDWDRQIKQAKIQAIKQEFKIAAQVVKSLPAWMRIYK